MRNLILNILYLTKCLLIYVSFIWNWGGNHHMWNYVVFHGTFGFPSNGWITGYLTSRF